MTGTQQPAASAGGPRLLSVGNNYSLSVAGYNRRERSGIFPVFAVKTARIQRTGPRWGTGLPRVVVEPLIQPYPALASNALAARASARTNAAAKKPARLSAPPHADEHNRQDLWRAPKNPTTASGIQR
jgi:hypothetical protein